MGVMPRPVALAGVNVLKTRILRNTANQMAYCDRATFATEDAMRVGQLHTLQPQWADATLSFMKSDGYKVAKRVKTIQQKTLVLWGRQDNILEPAYAERFAEEVPDSTLVWVENCGHAAHLERPSLCATRSSNSPTSKTKRSRPNVPSPRANGNVSHWCVFAPHRRASSSRISPRLVHERRRWFSRGAVRGFGFPESGFTAHSQRGGVATSAPGGEKSAKLMANAGSPSGTVSAPSQSDAPGNANILPT